jgi:hypothetical protein
VYVALVHGSVAKISRSATSCKPSAPLPMVDVPIKTPTCSPVGIRWQVRRCGQTLGTGLLEGQRYRGRSGQAVRMLLRALGEAGMKSGSRYIEFGTRTLDTTVAAHLRMLRDEVEPLVVLIENDRGLRGDLYELQIPDSIAKRAGALEWRAGKIHALRPVFRDLGLPLAFVYEALEHAKTAPTSFDLAQETQLARSTVYQALQVFDGVRFSGPPRRPLAGRGHHQFGGAGRDVGLYRNHRGPFGGAPG